MMDAFTPCPCGNPSPYSDCCGRYHAGLTPSTAEQLMRARYTAYVLGLIDYLKNTTLPAQQAGLDLEAIRDWSQNSRWLGLTVTPDTPTDPTRAKAQVCFLARWADAQGEHQHHECANFAQLDGYWFFIDPSVSLHSLGRNDACPCQSGLKFKKCCARAL